MRISEAEKRRKIRPQMTKCIVIRSLMSDSGLTLKEAKEVWKEASSQLPIGCNAMTILSAIYEAWDEDKDKEEEA